MAAHPHLQAKPSKRRPTQQAVKCWCGRPVTKRSTCGCCCLEHECEGSR